MTQSAELGGALDHLRAQWQVAWSELQLQARALVVCEDAATAAGLSATCREASVESDVVERVPDARAVLAERAYEIVLVVVPGAFSPLWGLLDDAGKQKRGPPYLVLLPAGELHLARQALTLGASDYLERPSAHVRMVGPKVRAAVDRRILERMTMRMTTDLKQALEGLDALSRKQMMAELTHSLGEHRRLIQRRGSRIVIVEPDEPTGLALADAASQLNATIMLGDPAAALETVQLSHAQVLVAAVTLTDGMSAPTLVRQVLDFDPHLEVVLVAADDEVGLAVEGMEAGAFDCLARPVRDPALARKCIARARKSQEQTVLHEYLLGELRRLTELYVEPARREAGSGGIAETLEADGGRGGGPLSGRDRRREPRTGVEVPISLWPAGNPAQVIEGKTFDVSVGGVGVQSIVVMPVGTPLGLSLEVPDGQGGIRTIIMEGQVSWVATDASGPGGTPGFGVRFTRVTPVVADVLRMLILEMQVRVR
jgi:DNA-binding response OmpR family regulator